MSIPVLIEVYDEVRRLAIAGSAVAVGDFRLKKLIPPLQKSGEKAPVFAKVAQAVQAVVESDEKTASSPLLDLTTLVNAILYTQGETGAAGDFKPLETTDLGSHTTQASARILKPLLEALSSTGSGRLEVVKDAFDRGTFKDMRLIKPALNALDDPYPEISDLIVEHVLPLYGKAILPELRAKLDIKGRGGHLNRLRLLGRLDPVGSREVIQQALSEGSKEMKVAAIECLGTSSEDLVYLLEQAQSKAKDVRAAALGALMAAGVTSGDVLAALKKGIVGSDLELIIPRVKKCSLPAIHNFVLEQAEAQLSMLFKLKDKNEQALAITRLQQLVYCVEDRTDAEAEAFLLKCFEHADAFVAIKSEPSGQDLNELVASVLSRGTPKLQKRLVAAHKTLTGGMIPPAIFAARATLAPADFYAQFSPLLKSISEKRSKKNSDDHDRATALLAVLGTRSEGIPFVHRAWMMATRYERRQSSTPLPPLDPRWLDSAIDADAADLVCKLARPGHEATNRFLSDRLEKLKQPHEVQEVLRTMVRINHPGAADAVIDVLKKLGKDKYHYYVGYWYGPMIAGLPKSALPKVDQLLPTLPEKMVDHLMDAVLELKNKPDEA